MTDQKSPMEGGISGPPPSYGTEADAAPPTYDQAVDTPPGDPPSYSALFGDIREARQTSGSLFEFLKKLLLLLAGTIGCTIAIGIVMAVPIAMIVIGAKYKDKCPVEEKIPIYLIVGGSVGIVRNILSLCGRAREDNEEGGKTRTGLSSLLDCFLTVWFICGNVWIYRNYEPSYTSGSNYCNQTLYLFAFWLTTATYIVLGTLCFCFCFVACCAAIFNEG